MSDTDQENRQARYEFRAWGERTEASARLADLADVELTEWFDDCYLLVPNRAYNAKIRRNNLKVKLLVDERFGFQRWTSTWPRASNAPEPFDQLLAELERCGELPASDEQALAGAIDGLEHRHGVRPVFVTKRRRRFRFESIRAETTDVEVGDQPGRLSTIAIEGRDLPRLIQLRSSLGLAHVPNLAMHLAVDRRIQSSVSVIPSSR